MSDSNLPDFLTALVLELGERRLLLPNTAIAELSVLRNLQTAEFAPDWFLGNMDWRGIRLPVVSFSRLAGDNVEEADNSRIVVINALSQPDKLRFFALTIKGVPRSVRVDKSLTVDPDVQLSPYEATAVSLFGEQMFIPKLEAVEKLLLSSISS